MTLFLLALLPKLFFGFWLTESFRKIYRMNDLGNTDEILGTQCTVHMDRYLHTVTLH